MAADPDAPLDPEAVPIGSHLSQTPGLLPAGDMPPAVARGRRWWMPVIVVVILGFLVVDVFGLCATYGVLTIACCASVDQRPLVARRTRRSPQ